MSSEVLIRGGRVIDPAQGTDGIMDVLCRNGKIAAAGKRLEKPPGAEVLDASGKVVAPAFVDMHVHLREPDGDAESETVETGAQAAARGGFASICAMPNTTPAIDTPQRMRQAQERNRKATVRVFQIAAITKNRAGRELVDFNALKEEGAIGFSDDGSPVRDEGIMRQAMERVAPLKLLIINHAEESGAGLYREAAMVQRDINLAMQSRCRVHIPHVSTKAAADSIREAKNSAPKHLAQLLTAEATPHHLVLSRRKNHGQDNSQRVNPPLRHPQNPGAIRAALADRVIDAIATDHAPHPARKKEGRFRDAAPGISGLETALGLCAALVHKGVMKLMLLVECMSTAPARIIGMPDLGTLKPGTPADIVVLDLERRWRVQPQEFASRGRNTPFKGRTLRGRVEHTICRGSVVYSAEGAAA